MTAKRGERELTFYTDLGELLASFSRIYYRWLWAQLKPSGSAPGWQTILGILHTGGPKIMSAISAEMNEAPRVITDAVDGLEGLGLVQRVPHPTDRRAKLIAITEAGQTFLEAGRVATQEAVAQLMGQFSVAEEDELCTLIGRLAGAIKSEVSEKSMPSTIELATSQNHRRNRKDHYVEVIRPI